jgi:hypothetical protein
MLGQQIDWFDPLANGLMGCWLLNEGVNRPRDLVKSVAGDLVSSAWGASQRGLVIVHDSTADRTTLLPTLATLPLQTVSIVSGYQKRDGVNRNSSLVGSASGDNSVRLGAHVPDSTGTVRWDVGGSAEGTKRLSIAGLTFGDDDWAFTSGPRGMEIWQNGVLRASNSANPTRTNDGTAWQLGVHNVFPSDLANFHYLYLYRIQLSPDAIRRLHAEPYAFILPLLPHRLMPTRFLGDVITTVATPLNHPARSVASLNPTRSVTKL